MRVRKSGEVVETLVLLVVAIWCFNVGALAFFRTPRLPNKQDVGNGRRLRGRREENYRVMVRLSGFLVFCVVFVPIPALADTSPQAVELSLTVFPCVKDAALEPTLRISDIAQTFANVPIKSTWTTRTSDWQTTVTVPVGHYIVSAIYPHCTGETEQWVAIPGAARHLAITMNKSKVTTVDEDMYAGAIYGTLPSPAARVEVMEANSAIGEQTRRSAMTDGDTYQIGHLRSGDYVVRVVFGNVIASRAVHVPKDTYGPAVRADLTSADALSLVGQQASGSKFVPVPNVEKEPAVTFRLGAASANGWTTAPLIPPSDYRIYEQRIDAAVAGAFLVANQFLGNDPRIPASFRTLFRWSVAVWKNDDDIVLNLSPTDLTAWQKQPPKTPEQCYTLSGTHYVRLAINEKTWKVDESRVCP